MECLALDGTIFREEIQNISLIASAFKLPVGYVIVKLVSKWNEKLRSKCGNC